MSRRVYYRSIVLLSLLIAGCGTQVTVPTAMNITPMSTSINPGESIQLSAMLSNGYSNYPATPDTITWATSDSSLTIKSGLATCHKAGNVTITASAVGISAEASIICLFVPTSINLNPPSANIVSGQSIQLAVTLSDGTTTESAPDQSVTWSASDPSLAIKGGLATCKNAGSFRATASVDGLSANSNIDCLQNQIRSLALVSTPAIIRSEASFQYKLLATYSDGSSQDVTASATWGSGPSVSFVSASGLVSCNTTGSSTVSATVSGLSVTTKATCVLRSVVPAPGFYESAKRFDGPFTSWVNVKTAFGAKGDGITDDTAAFKRAENLLMQSSGILWIPSGTYVISSSLKMASTASFAIIGEDPLTTTILWKGAAGGTMTDFDGCSSFKLARITWDGGGTAGIDIDIHWSQQPGSLYPTRDLIQDSRINNAVLGIHNGFAGETTVDRVHFDHDTAAGASLDNWNAFNFNVINSLFTDCGYGVTNNLNGSGNFNVSNSVFVRSTVSDVGYGNTGSFSFRSNISYHSARFLFVLGNAPPANAVIQGNTIIATTLTPITIADPGPVMLIDNRFLQMDPSFNILYANNGNPTAFVALGNSYAVATEFSGTIGQHTAFDEAPYAADQGQLPAIPTEVYFARPSGRAIHEVSPGATSSDISAIINATIAAGSGVVHIPRGQYSFLNTVEVSGSADITITGDGDLTQLTAALGLQGPVLRISGTNVQLEDISVMSSTGEDDIVLNVPDAPSTRVLCDECSTGFGNAIAVEVDGLDEASVEFHVAELDASPFFAEAVWIHGGAARQSGLRTLGRVAMFMTSADSYKVDSGGYFFINDGFHDGGQGLTQMTALGSGFITHQGGIVYAGPQSMVAQGYSGRISLLGVEGNTPLTIEPGSHANVLSLAGAELDGQAPTVNLEPADNVVQLDDYFIPSYVVTPIPNTTFDEVGVENMMSVARTQYAIPRTPTTLPFTNILFSRVLLDWGGTAGIRISNSNSTPNSNTYSITPTSGSNPPSGCSQGTATMAGGWTSRDGGDGFYGFANGGVYISELTAAPAGANMATGTMDSALSRWIVRQTGDGSNKIVNRATGDVLTRAASGCAYAAPESTDGNQLWLVGMAP